MSFIKTKKFPDPIPNAIIYLLIQNSPILEILYDQEVFGVISHLQVLKWTSKKSCNVKPLIFFSLLITLRFCLKKKKKYLYFLKDF